MDIKHAPDADPTLGPPSRGRFMHPSLSMMASPGPGAAEPGEALPAPDSAVVLAYARMLQREALAGSRQPWLRGKNIAMVGSAEDAEADGLFRRAAAELGAKVAQVRPFAEGTPATAAEAQHIARVIGRLYDAIEWPQASAHQLERLRPAAGIPVYDGLAGASHPTARLVNLLDAASPVADRRCFIVQAVLLATIV
jgi:ornithine carbamoyltransferase